MKFFLPLLLLCVVALSGCRFSAEMGAPIHPRSTCVCPCQAKDSCGQVEVPKCCCDDCKCPDCRCPKK